MVTVSDFIFLGSKITAEDDCSHEIKRHLLLGRKVITNLESINSREDGRSQDGGGTGRVITFSSTNSLKEQQNGEQSLQNNF